MICRILPLFKKLTNNMKTDHTNNSKILIGKKCYLSIFNLRIQKLFIFILSVRNMLSGKRNDPNHVNTVRNVASDPLTSKFAESAKDWDENVVQKKIPSTIKMAYNEYVVKHNILTGELKSKFKMTYTNETLTTFYCLAYEQNEKIKENTTYKLINFLTEKIKEEENISYLIIDKLVFNDLKCSKYTKIRKWILSPDLSQPIKQEKHYLHILNLKTSFKEPTAQNVIDNTLQEMNENYIILVYNKEYIINNELKFAKFFNVTIEEDNNLGLKNFLAYKSNNETRNFFTIIENKFNTNQNLKLYYFSPRHFKAGRIKKALIGIYSQNNDKKESDEYKAKLTSDPINYYSAIDNSILFENILNYEFSVINYENFNHLNKFMKDIKNHKMNNVDKLFLIILTNFLNDNIMEMPKRSFFLYDAFFNEKIFKARCSVENESLFNKNKERINDKIMDAQLFKKLKDFITNILEILKDSIENNNVCFDENHLTLKSILGTAIYSNYEEQKKRNK